jgi:hypothetical protein
MEISGNKVICFYGNEFEKTGVASLLSNCPLLQSKEQSDI